jgi:hypothetical protein
MGSLSSASKTVSQTPKENTMSKLVRLWRITPVNEVYELGTPGPNRLDSKIQALQTRVDELTKDEDDTINLVCGPELEIFEYSGGNSGPRLLRAVASELRPMNFSSESDKLHQARMCTGGVVKASDVLANETLKCIKPTEQDESLRNLPVGDGTRISDLTRTRLFTNPVKIPEDLFGQGKPQPQETSSPDNVVKLPLAINVTPVQMLPQPFLCSDKLPGLVYADGIILDKNAVGSEQTQPARLDGHNA